jgi:membrane peptidoglycan carboxypeptidase
VLRDLSDPEKAVEMGVTGYRLLDPQYASSVIYTFSLYEKTKNGNVLRVQTDNYQGPLNLNEGSKLELGSTAKLRTLVSYLEAVSDSHALYSERTPEELQMIRQTISPKDNITLWAIDYLSAPETDKSLKGMVEASLDRTYSSSTGEIFFTGGGAHQFVNFDNKDNGRVVTVREATYKSINLPYIRMMRDVVNFNMTHKMNVDPAIFTDLSPPRRAEYLEKFADMEGRQFMNMFWKQMDGKTPAEMLATLAGKTRGTPAQLAVVYRHVYPDAPVEKMAEFIAAHCKNCRPEQNFESLYAAYAPGKFNLNDQGYIARVHPLDLWLTAYRINHPGAKRTEVLAQSRNERIEVYKWLLRSNKYEAQNNRIRIMLEQEAFTHIRQGWQKMGFPFSQMIPSYASALGASGDTPKGLATMAGILQNGGVKKPTIDFRSIEFGANTPYQFRAERQVPAAQRILPQEVADAAVEVMQGVIERGTARRAYQSIKLADGTILPVGGKTGTGDNRDESHTSSGATTSSSVRNRTAAFVFTVGDRFYGSIVAYVPGEQAANFKFTSALPVTVFTKLAPALSPVLNRAYTGERTEEAVPDVKPIEMENLPQQSIEYQGEKPSVPVDGDNVPVISYDPETGTPVVPGEAPAPLQNADGQASLPVEGVATDAGTAETQVTEVRAADTPSNDNNTPPQNQALKALPVTPTITPKRQGPTP